MNKAWYTESYMLFEISIETEAYLRHTMSIVTEKSRYCVKKYYITIKNVDGKLVISIVYGHHT